MSTSASGLGDLAASVGEAWNVAEAASFAAVVDVVCGLTKTDTARATAACRSAGWSPSAAVGSLGVTVGEFCCVRVAAAAAAASRRAANKRRG